MGVVELSTSVTAFLFILLIWLSATVYIVWQFYFSGREEKLELHKYLRKTTLSYLLSYDIAYFTALLYTGLTLNYHEYFYDYNRGHDILFSIIFISGTFGYMSFYLFLTSRLYYLFEPTQYAMSKRTYNIYIGLAIIAAILFAIYAASYYLIKSLLFIAFPIAIIAVILNLFIAISLVYLFTNKLTKFASEPSEFNNSLSRRQENYVRIAAKHCLLGCIGISMFNLFIPITVSLYAFYVIPHTIGPYLLTVGLCFLFHTIEMLTVLLSFAFSKKYYFFICNKCDQSCINCLTSIAVKKMEDNINSRKGMRLGSHTQTASNLSTIETQTKTRTLSVPRATTQESGQSIELGGMDTITERQISHSVNTITQQSTHTFAIPNVVVHHSDIDETMDHSIGS